MLRIVWSHQIMSKLVREGEIQRHESRFELQVLDLGII